MARNEGESTVGGARFAELFVEAVTSFHEYWEAVGCWESAQSHLRISSPPLIPHL